MKILVLSWEFPPRIVGGISRHVGELYPEIVKLGHEVHIITVAFGQAPFYEIVDGIHVHRVSIGYSDNFNHWVSNMNHSMGGHAAKLIHEEGKFDLIHAHDWLVGDCAIALQKNFQIPLIATIHATEYGRHNGIHTGHQYYIHSKEAELAHHANRIIVCSRYMEQEMERAFQVSSNKVDIIFNGIRPEKKNRPENFDLLGFRRRFAKDEEKIIYYVGRMTYEKGISVLLSAAPKVIWEMEGNAKFVIIGGGNTDDLKKIAWDLGIWHKCYFTGFMSDSDLDQFQTIANCAVFPSLYEPFGIVALESFAARVPVVVSSTGGMPEVVQHGKTGIVTYVNDYHSLAWGILEILKNPDYAENLVENAYKDLYIRFRWEDLAKQTDAVYRRVLNFQ
jgi:glycosyltransferase involved in cell wall biosynthesis